MPSRLSRLAAAALLVAASACQSANQYEPDGATIDLWIRGGSVIDGSGTPARKADVLVSGDSIVFVGNVGSAQFEATRIIDATGKVVTPGFIDTHAHGNPARTPGFDNFLAMGVTTIALGQDGGGPQVVDPSAFIDSLNAGGLGVNVAYFAGHGTIRMMSGVEYDTEPTDAGIDSMKSILRSQLEGGFFGMTTGLEYTPGIYSGDDELMALAEVVGEYDRLIMSHMRNEDDDAVEASLRELLRQGREAAVQVSHFKSVYGKGAARAEELLAILDSARATGTQVTADLYPYTASYTDIGIVFPTWAKAPNDYDQVRAQSRDSLLRYVHDRVMLRNGPEATLLGTGEYEGKTLADLAEESGKPFEEILVDDIGPRGASGAYFVMDDALQERLAQDPFVMFCSDGSPTGFHPRGHGTFARIIETFVREKKLFTLEEAVRKMTWLPAQTLGLDGRGRLATGYVADVLVFDPKMIHETATYTNPLSNAEGMDVVLVAGVRAYEGGSATSDRPGRVLRASKR
ncbi:MAG: amidohydrolase family protein [Bacteroidetes bacterium]|nr:amidohydrolase family protein [Bacteroidota bacterium]